MEELKDKIIRLRLEKGLRQSQVAKAAGIKQPSYASIEKGQTKNISLNVAIGIARALGVSFAELYDTGQSSNSDHFREQAAAELKMLNKREREELEFYRSLFQVLSYFEVLDMNLFEKYNPEFSGHNISSITPSLHLASQFLIKFKENSIDEIQKYIDVEKYQNSSLDSNSPWKQKIIEYIKIARTKLA